MNLNVSSSPNLGTSTEQEKEEEMEHLKLPFWCTVQYSLGVRPMFGPKNDEKCWFEIGMDSSKLIQSNIEIEMI